MSCGCKKKVQIINNMHLPSTQTRAKELYNEVSKISLEAITDDLWMLMYEWYNKTYPNSKGQPNKAELITIMEKAANYKKIKTRKK